MRLALMMATLLAWAPGQESKPAATPAKESKPQSARQKRLLRDLEQVAANLRKQPHGYRGSLVVRSPTEMTLLMPLERDFHGAAHGKLSWFSMSRWQSVTYGDHTIGRRIPERVPGALRTDHKEPVWGHSKAEAPEVPLTPLLLAPHFEHATLSKPEPAEYGGRPAMRVYASWRGRAAKKVVYATTIPSTQHEQVLEALGTAAGKGRQNILVDAVIVFDPATKSWLATTLRLAHCNGKPLDPDDDTYNPPAGMPALTSHPQIEATWRLRSCEPSLLPKPKLDAAARRRLGMPARGVRQGG